jgi:dolichyl-phosphate beta-glucosyltransferase
MNPHRSLIIVIPCYNEEKRFTTLRDEYTSFLDQNEDVLLCFVDDGSTDDTVNSLQSMKRDHESKIEIFVSPKNQGKAEAVRAGIQFCDAKFDYEFIAFLDADLSTTFSECLRLYAYIEKNEKIGFAFASRILKIGSDIQRKKFRFVTGRIIATVISSILGLKVYDTQCGCKVFNRDLARKLFQEKFISKWLFDVEIFFRMIHLYGHKGAIERMVEIPLKLWVDKGDSKVRMSYFFKLWVDLFRIKRRYRGKHSNHDTLLIKNGS